MVERRLNAPKFRIPSLPHRGAEGLTETATEEGRQAGLREVLLLRHLGRRGVAPVIVQSDAPLGGAGSSYASVAWALVLILSAIVKGLSGLWPP